MNGIKNDLLAGIVVTLVAIPLCLGIALACNAPLFSGILTGIIGGIVVGIFSKSNLSVSGPAAGMIAVVVTAITQLGSFELFLLALTLAGLIQILCGLFRTGFIANFVPTNVIQGLLAAIGILIIVKQLPLAFGYFATSTTLHESLAIESSPLNIGWILSIFHHLNMTAITITIFSLAILIGWQKVLPKLSKFIPAGIFVVFFSIFINLIFKWVNPALALKPAHLINMPINETLKEFFAQFKHPNFSGLTNPKVYVYGMMIAIVASLESILNLEAVEKLDPHHQYSSRNRELVAQGIGNITSGLLGGLPITSVIIRSSANINAGAKTKLSTIFHGVLLLLSLAFFSKYLNYIPLSALAAILIFTGYKLTSLNLFKEAYREGIRYFIPFLVTTISIIFANLLLGILIGLTVSLLFILYSNSKNGFTSVCETHSFGTVLRLILPQQATFLNKAAIVESLNAIPKNSKVTIDARSTEYIDNDILGAIKDFKERQAKDKNILLNLVGFKNHYEMINQVKFINVTTFDVQQSLTPNMVLRLLLEGNKRFIENSPVHKDFKQQITATAQSQHPIAVILSCIDSRVPVELIFDLNLGDVFVARIAGNIVNDDIIGSIEYACEIAGAKLIVILGHKGCGIIKSACDDFKFGYITNVVEKIKPAIDAENHIHFDLPHDSDAFINHVVRSNVELTKSFLYQKSSAIKKLIQCDQIKMVGAVYDIHSGLVEFDMKAE